MLKFFATEVTVSKGANNTPALKFSDKGDFVRFRIGAKIYDTRAEKNHRWVNLTVKAFGPLCERIKKMQLKDGSFIHIAGRLDEDSWVDSTTNEKKSQIVIILDEIEYASGGGNKSSKDTQQSGAAAVASPTSVSANNPESSPNFEGYTPFGGGSFFDA